MSPYRLKKVLDEGGIGFGATVQIPATAIVEILGRAGFDFAIIDTEHGLFDMTTAGELIRAGHGAGLSPIVRVLKNDETLIMKALDLGAEGVIVPHISTRDDAERAARACRYGSGYVRGACPLVRAADYGLSEWRAYEKESNEKTLFFALIEDLEGARNVEEIASVDGVDVVVLGAFDMSVSAGYSGNVAHPAVQEALDRMLVTCADAGIPVMHALSNGPDVDAWVKRGVRLMYQSADSAVFARACRSFLDSVGHLRTPVRALDTKSDQEGSR